MVAEPLHSLTHVIETAISSLRRRPRNFPPIIEWACPVPFFGCAEQARLASEHLPRKRAKLIDAKNGHGAAGAYL